MADTIFCSKCGARLDGQAQFCVSCGSGVAAPATATAPPPPQFQAAAAPAPAMAPQPQQAMTPPPPAAAPQQYGAVPPGSAPQTAYAGVPPGVASPYAGFWARVGAYLIDVLILIVPLIVVTLIPILGIILNIAGLWLYFALQESSERQATIGKRAVGIYVTDLQGRRISFGQATARYFSKILSSILAIGYIMVAFTEKKQGLHDIIASTLVVRR